MGFYKKKLKIKVLYKGKWYYASSVMINEEGLLDIQYCHGLDGSVDEEYVDEIKIEEMQER